MKKKVFLASMGVVVAGVIATALIIGADHSKMSDEVIPASGSREHRGGLSSLEARIDSSTNTVIDGAGAKVGVVQPTRVPYHSLVPPPVGEKIPEEEVKRALDATRKRETSMLLAAGFAQDRIDWIMRRKEELRVELAERIKKREEAGLAPDPYDARYLLDGDLDLRDEVGSEEYEKIRWATGRPTTFRLTGVLAGGNASAAGLRDGDEIIAYNGKRVFNIFDLQHTAEQVAPGGDAVVDLRRNGQAVQVHVRTGPLDLRRQSPFEILMHH